jgi:tetratricopeptide (TPR) repeat protein
LSLSSKQKKLILRKKDKLAPKQIAKELNLKLNVVEEFLGSSTSKKVPTWFYLVLIFIPILFIILLESGLRIFDYGRTYDQWVNAGDGKLTLNPEIAYRYFYTTEQVPSAGNNIFDEVKKDNCFRVFVMGGSSAAGFPFTPNGSFVRYIRHRLQILYPQKTFEVVNIAMSAINSYALGDMLPGVIDQKPDLIIIYAGHNEYYGALGVGSMESLGDTRYIVNTVLWLNRFKTFELLRNIIKSIYGLFAQPEITDATLMARMSQKQLIPYNSDSYYYGIDQFEGNLNDILRTANDADIPVLLGTLVSNLKDQKPFSSIDHEKNPPAEEIYNLATNELSAGNTKSADSLFRFAKDLDALKWRAPERMNEVIKELGEKYNFPVIKLDSIFNEISPDKIVGDNLITDHLHPNLKGFQIIGKAYFDKGIEVGIFPEQDRSNYSLHLQDSLTLSRYLFTELDSTIARFQIIILKSDWPYIKEKKSDEEKLKSLNMQTYTDSLAFLVGKRDLSWISAHLQLAGRKFNEGDKDGFIIEINTVIDEYPFDPYPIEFGANLLVNNKEFEDAYPYLLRLHGLKQSAFSSKWLGIIDLLNNRIDPAIVYLSQSLNYSANDAQVIYNLSGAYSRKKDYHTALQIVNRCLEIEPNYPQAIDLQRQLINALKEK